MSSVASMLTVGEIARRLGQPIHRIEYLIRSRDIEPLGKAGNALVYSDPVYEAIARELARVDTALACRSRRKTVPGLASDLAGSAGAA